MKILVTGASGFAGSHLISALTDSGYSDLHGTTFTFSRFLETLIPRDHIVPIDLSKSEEVSTLLTSLKPDWIFHLAAFAAVGTSFDKPEFVMTNNIALQLHLFETIKKHNLQTRVLSVGSAEEYGWSEPDEIPINEDHALRPVNPYAVSKTAQDLLAYSYRKSCGLDIVNVRPFNHIGERQSPEFAVSAFAKQIAAIEVGKQHSIKVGNLEAIRDFTDVKDMVRAYITVMEKGKSGEVYNIGSGVGISMKQILDLLISYASCSIKVEKDLERMRPIDIKEVIADRSKITQLGWKPEIKLEETLHRILDWWRGQNDG